MTLTAAWT